MEQSGKISHRQLMALIFVSLCGIEIRLLPGASAALAGRSSWLSPIAAIVPAALILWLMRVIERSRLEGESMTGLFCRAVTPFVGKALAVVFALCFLASCGFLLAAEGDGLVTAVYPNGQPAPFFVITGIAALIAARGKITSLCRTAEVGVMIILALLGLVLIFAIRDVELKNLLPVTFYDTGDILKGAVPISEVLALPVLFLFLAGEMKKEPGSRRTGAKWMAYIIIIVFLVTAVTMGVMGEALVAGAQDPFYAMVRNIGFKDVIQRIDPVVVAVWVVSDFTCAGALLYMASGIFAEVFGGDRSVWALPCAAAAIAGAFLMPEGIAEYRNMAAIVVPAVNAGLAVVIIPIIIIVGKATKRI